MSEVPSSTLRTGVTGRQVLAGLVATFALIFAVNGVFAYFAISTWPGYAQNDAYERGLRYNEVLDEARRQKALGWTSSVAMQADGRFRVRLTDPNNVAVKVSSLSISFSRPLGDAKDINCLLYTSPSPRD